MNIDKKEISRDIISLGGIPFLILVLIRVYIADNYNQLFQIVCASILLFLVLLKFKKINYRISMMVILTVFMSVFYNEYKFTILTSIVLLIGAYGAKKYLKKDGFLIFEIGYHHSKPVKKIMEENGFENIMIVNDCLKQERIIYGKNCN